MTRHIVRAGMAATAAGLAVTVLAASGPHNQAVSAPASSSPSAAPSSPAPSPWFTAISPADVAICNTWNADVANASAASDLTDLAQQLLAAGTTVSYKLRHDTAVYVADANGANGGSDPGTQLKNDEKNMITVMMDCSVVQAKSGGSSGGN